MDDNKKHIDYYKEQIALASIELANLFVEGIKFCGCTHHISMTYDDVDERIEVQICKNDLIICQKVGIIIDDQFTTSLNIISIIKKLIVVG